jgi:glycosyltransferase involved in cell wall biosynthesis
MIIVHVISDLSAGGAENMLKKLVGAHRDAAFQHSVVSLRGLGTIGPQLQQLGVPVHALGMRGVAHIPAMVVRLARKFGELKPDIVHCWMYHGDFLGGLAARVAGIRHVVWSVRVTEFTREMGVPRMTLALRRICALMSGVLPERIVYVAQSARRSHERIGYASGRGEVIPNGYELPDPPRDSLRRELALPGDAVIVGTAGRYKPQKGPRGFVEASARLAAQDARLHFVMIGRGFDEDNAELMGWVRATGRADCFHALGERRDLLPLLADMDVFCLNSIGEGFPNVVAEAMSVGVPCVATDVGDTACLVGDTGTIIPPRNTDALAAALGRMISLTAGERQEIGRRARDRIAAHFSLDAIVRRYEDLYRSLVAGTARASEAAEVQD